MKVYSVRIDNREMNKILKNVAAYSEGFVNGIKMNRTMFNNIIGQYVKEMLEQYIDSQARSNPDALHHVYEWNATGSPGARLFEFDVRATQRSIHFSGKFLQSSSVSDTSDTPFYNKAEVMENSIDIVIEPKNSDVLVFESGGETVFTVNSIYVANPGGDAVAGSFGKVVDQFFSQFLTAAILEPIFKDLRTADEYTSFFPLGAKSGYGPGLAAGRKYLTPKVADIS